MKKFIILVLALCMCAFVLAGCGEKQPQEEETTPVVEIDSALLGSWMEDYFDSGYTFNEDFTGRNLFYDLPYTYTAADGVITLNYEDTSYGTDKFRYSIDGDTLTLTRSDTGNSFVYKKK